MRPIDADNLRRIIKECTECAMKDGHEQWAGAFGASIMYINKCPTLDVSPVVRCKDCRSWAIERIGDVVGWCNNPSGIDDCCHQEDYCSYGRRKDGE